MRNPPQAWSAWLSPCPTRGAHGPSLGLSVTALKATYSAEQGSQMVKELKELARSLGNPMG